MTSSISSYFEGCDLAALDSSGILFLSTCWREGKISMAHRNGKVDVTLTCGPEDCSCAKALDQGPSA